jgi:hypothetical protein
VQRSEVVDRGADGVFFGALLDVWDGRALVDGEADPVGAVVLPAGALGEFAGVVAVLGSMPVATNGAEPVFDADRGELHAAAPRRASTTMAASTPARRRCMRATWLTEAGLG